MNIRKVELIADRGGVVGNRGVGSESRRLAAP